MLTGSELSLSETLHGASNVLLLAPALCSHSDDACVDLLTAAPPEDTRVISIAVTRSPETHLATWEKRVDRSPAKTVLIAAGEQIRSNADVAAAGVNSVGGHGGVTIDTVPAPGDLTGIGVRVTERLREWEAAEGQIAVCFHSLTPLLQYSTPETVFRFLHVLARKIRESGAIAHYHMDPGAHDEKIVNTFMSAVDAVIEMNGEDDVTIRGR